MSELGTLALLLICFAVKPLTAQFYFQIEPTETVVVLGNPVIFNCQANDVQNRGSILIHWKKNNYPLSSSSSLFMYQNGSLHFTSTERQDEGLYSCVATLQDSSGIIELIESVAANLYFAFLDPVFFHPQSVEAVDRQVEPVNFQCVSGSSRPLATIYWEKDGVRFDGGISSQAGYGSTDSLKTSATLQINAVQTSDGGRYRCVVENALLPSTTMRSTYADLTVQPNPGVPYISQPPSSKIVAVNTTETLPCRIVGDPAPTITWTKDGVTVAVFDDIEILTNGDLYFETLQESNSGQYVCTGTSRLGSVSTDPIQLTVAVMQWSFVSSPANVDTLVGSSATIICRPPYSVPPANVTWYKDNIEYTPPQGVSIISPGDLHFAFVEVSDEGQYFCTASNSYLSRTVTSSSSTSFTVNVAASISLPPNRTEVILGNDLQLQCLVAGKPTPVVTWYKYNQPLSPGNRITIGNSGQLLHIISISTLDEGTYTCRAANVYGSESTSAFVDVIVAPQISVAPGNVTGSEFGSIIIPCEVTGDPKPDIMWLKDGLELTILPNDPHYQLTNQGLLISDLHVVDEGSYTCIAVNQAGSVQSPGQLIIEVAPIIVAPPANQTVNDGSVLYFQCEAEGNPPPNYEWRFNDRPLPSWATVSLNGDIVTIQFASIEQVGKYSCRAYNRQGQAEAHAYLTVETSPVVSAINDIEVVSGSEIRVSCYAAGYPAPLFSWLKNGHALLPNSKVRFPSSNSLFVSNAQNTDQGIYTCVASNGIGSDRDSFYISVVAKPDAPYIQMVVAVNPMSVNLSWVPTGDVADSKQYTVQYKQSISALWVTYADNIVSTPGIQSYVVNGLIESQTYMFRVFAKNSVSVSDPSTVATFTTPSVSGPSAPRNLQVRSGNSSAVVLVWEIPSTRYAPIHKYEVNYYPSLTTTDQRVVEISGGVEPTVEHTVTGLMAGMSYSFRVRASTVTAGLEQWGDYSPLAMFTTSPAPPATSPSNIGLVSTSPSTIKITWTEIPAMFLSEPLLGYNIEYSTNTVTKTQRSSGVTTATALTNLQHYTVYTIRIQGFSESGFGPYSSPMTIQTLPGAPSSAPTALTASATSQTSLHVSWNGVSEASAGGPLSGYILHYQHLLDQVLFNITVPAPQTSTNISGLQAGNSYILQVSAYNQVGTTIVEGPRSESITATTMDGIPGPVRNVAATPGPTSLVIRWWSPEQNNGEILDYTLEYKLIKLTTANEQESLNQQIVWANATSGVIVTSGLVYTLEGLLPNSTYRVSIKARTSAGLAVEAVVNDFTTGEIAVTPAPSGIPPSSTTPDSGINIPATDSAQEGNTSPLSFPNKTSLIIFICCVVLAGVAFAMAAVVLLVWCKSLEDNNFKRKSATFLLPNEQLSGGGSSAASDHVPMTTQLSTSGSSALTLGRTDVEFVEPFTPESKPVVASSTPTTNGHQRHFQTKTPQPTRVQSALPNLYAPRRPAPKTPNGVNGAAKPLSAKLQADDTSPENLDLLFTEISGNLVHQQTLAAIASLLDQEQEQPAPVDDASSYMITKQRTTL